MKAVRKWQCVLAVIALIALLGSCSANWAPPKWQAPKIHLPKKGPVDLFFDIIDQVEQIGRSITRQFQGFGRSTQQ